jgi:predicted amidohydrolase
MKSWWKVDLIPLRTTPNYKKNLEAVVEYTNYSTADLVLFPEVVLTGFDYQNWEEMNRFGEYAFQVLGEKVNKPVGLTIVKDGFNFFTLFAPGGYLYQRPKFHLFGIEKKFFEGGLMPTPFIFEGVTILPLICFELRFVEYWAQYRGQVDLVLIPSRWGRERADHFKTLVKGAALSLQSWVVGVNSPNEFGYTGAINGWGEGVTGTQRFATIIDLEENYRIRKKLPLE